jgi:ribosomal protein L11 methyltransferase
MAGRLYAAIELTFVVRPDEETIEQLVADLDDGALAAIEDDDALAWRAYFDSPDARDRALASFGGRPFVAAARAVDVADQQWAERSQASLGPVRVGAIVVVPPWRTGDPAGTAPGVRHVIVINPSMGFGTGHHASTRRCLALLQSLDIAGQTVLDVGTGSGVLAVAASRLGASAVVAIDSDADAIASARESLARNGAGVVSLVTCDLSALPAPTPAFDGALANLTGATLAIGSARLSALVKPGGWLVAGGIEVDEVDAVTAALERAGWREAARDIEDGWVGLRLVRRVTSPRPTR